MDWPGWIGAIGTICCGLCWLGERISRRKAERARQAAEQKLRAAQSITAGPLLFPYGGRFNICYAGGMGWSSAKDNVLCWRLAEVPREIPKGSRIGLVLENRGKKGEDVRIECPVQSIALETDGKTGEGHAGLCVLHYPFDPDAIGVRQEIEFHFTGTDGFHHVHRYVCEHGKRCFRRVYPVAPDAAPGQ